MRACQTFHRRLQIKVECCPDRPAKPRLLRHNCIHKMWRKVGRIVACNFRRIRQQRLLVARDNPQISKPPQRPRIFTTCFLCVSPGVETRWRLRQTGEENCFTQSEIASWFAEIRASSGLRSQSPIPVTAAIQVFRKNSLLAPPSFQFPSDDCLIKFATPTASVTAAREFHELLSDRGCARNNVQRSQVPCACGKSRAGVNATVFVEPAVFQRHGYAWQPRPHLLKRDWKLGARVRRCEFGNSAAATIEQRQCSARRFLQFV